MGWFTTILVSAGVGAAALTVAKKFMGGSSSKATGFDIPDKARPYVAIIAKWANQRRIPIDIVLSWISLESGFNKNSYNPEKGAMKKWACEIAGNEKWKINPEYAKAVAVCQALTSGAKTADQISDADAGKAFDQKQWTFGSVGLMQVSRQASGSSGYAMSKKNSGMFDPNTNVMVGTQIISNLRRAIYGDKIELSILEWSLCRAAYVMGAAGLMKRLELGTLTALDPVHDKQRKFYAALSEIRGQKVAVNLVQPTVA